MKRQPIPFDAAAYLDSEALVAEYLGAALEDPDPAAFLAALSAVARAQGMAQVSQRTGLGRESLYKALAPGAHPRYETIIRVLRGLGVRLSVTPPTR